MQIQVLISLSFCVYFTLSACVCVCGHHLLQNYLKNGNKQLEVTVSFCAAHHPIHNSSSYTNENCKIEK